MILLGISLLALLAGFIALQGSKTELPSLCSNCNVLFIVVDTLGASHIKAFGGTRDTMPKTTAFFKEHGALFTNAYATAPWTLPSISSTLFSEYPHAITYKDLEGVDRPELIGLLRSSGYVIRALVDDELLFILDAIYRPFSDGELTRAESPMDLAISAIKELRTQTRPYFLFVHDFNVHDPYKPQSPYDEYFGKTNEFPIVTMSDIQKANSAYDATTTEIFKLRYDQGIAQMDERIAHILDSLTTDDLTRTIIVVTSDHGEAFGEHGLLGHALTLHEEEVHVPLFVFVPGMAPETSATPVSLIDIAPTLAALAGIEIPEQFVGAHIFNKSDGPLYFVNGMPYYAAEIGKGGRFQTTLDELGASGSPRALIEPDSYGVKSGDWKLFYSNGVSNPYAPQVKTSDPDGIGLYNTAKDPRETHDMSATLEQAPPTLLKTFIEFGAYVTTP